jgi:serine/threonine protein kinase
LVTPKIYDVSNLQGYSPNVDRHEIHPAHNRSSLPRASPTLNYMAPEQRENTKDVDHRADIYSLGVVFYEMLTGEVPMGRFDAPSKKVQVDVRLDEVVLHALEREPARRYQQASEVKSNVETITSSAPSGDAGAPKAPESIAQPATEPA